MRAVCAEWLHTATKLRSFMHSLGRLRHKLRLLEMVRRGVTTPRWVGQGRRRWGTHDLVSSCASSAWGLSNSVGAVGAGRHQHARSSGIEHGFRQPHRGTCCASRQRMHCPRGARRTTQGGDGKPTPTCFRWNRSRIGRTPNRVGVPIGTMPASVDQFRWSRTRSWMKAFVFWSDLTEDPLADHNWSSRSRQGSTGTATRGDASGGNLQPRASSASSPEHLRGLEAGCPPPTGYVPVGATLRHDERAGKSSGDPLDCAARAGYRSRPNRARTPAIDPKSLERYNSPQQNVWTGHDTRSGLVRHHGQS
jgi:hypothetical protein